MATSAPAGQQPGRQRRGDYGWHLGVACCDAAGMGRRSVKVMSDYSCGWPVWLDGGLASDQFPEEVGLSAELWRDLVAVQEFFEERFHWDGGWRGAGDDAQYAGQMVDVFFRLQRELGDGWAVELDLWPVADEAILLSLRRKGIIAPPPRRR